MPTPPSSSTSSATPSSTNVDTRDDVGAVTTGGCLPADQSCFALSAASSPRYSTRRDTTTTATTTRACCTTASYIVVLGISFGSLLAILFILCMIRWYLVWRSSAAHRRQDSGAADEAAPGSATKKRSPGLDADAIAALPEFAYKREEGGGEDEDEDEERERECAVCLCTMADGEAARRLPRCMHLFHRGCVDVWLREHSTCPVCRVEVVVVTPADGVRAEKVQESSASRALTSPARAPDGMVDDGRERDLEAQ
ncbi:hypothetical protein ABZP36_028192 [Zizania latifolia]